jgi:putative cofactor-binding repeat protein
VVSVGDVHYPLLAAGGVSIADASPTVTGNVLVGNAGNEGGGIGAAGGSPLITDNLVSGSTGLPDSNGGGLYLENSVDAVVTGNTIENISWPGFSGGAEVGGVRTVFAGNVIKNVSSWSGAVLLVGGAEGMSVADNVIVDDSGPRVVFVDGDGDGIDIVGNTLADDKGETLHLENGYGRAVVRDTVLAGVDVEVTCADGPGAPPSRPATFDHDDFSGAAVPAKCGALTASQGDTTAAPSFVSGGYEPAAGSVLVDAGTADAALPATDVAGNPRVVDGNGDGKAVVDIGAYERQ